MIYRSKLVGVRFVLASSIAVAVAAGLLTAPAWGSYYEITVLRDALILGVFALSLDFLWGKAGLPSFGHAAFFGLGGYLYAVTAANLNPSYAAPVGVICAVSGGVFMGLFLGLFLIRAGVRGSLFLIVSIALTQIGRQIAISWSAVTGGDAGLVGVPPLSLTILSHRLELLDPKLQYLFAVIISFSVLAALWALTRGRYGRLLSAIVNDENRALTLGVNTSWRLTTALAISTGIAALAGAVYVSMEGVIVPDLIGPLFSIEVVVWVLVGGVGTLIGPFVGTFVVWRLSQDISSYDPRVWPLLIGAFFVSMPFAFPDGIVSLGRGTLLRMYAKMTKPT